MKTIAAKYVSDLMDRLVGDDGKWSYAVPGAPGEKSDKPIEEAYGLDGIAVRVNWEFGGFTVFVRPVDGIGHVVDMLGHAGVVGLRGESCTCLVERALKVLVAQRAQYVTKP